VDDVSALAGCLERAVKDDDLCLRARHANWRIAEQRMDRSVLRDLVRTWVAEAMSS
jgi:hypothetical protein